MSETAKPIRYCRMLIVSGDDPGFPVTIRYSSPMGPEEVQELEEMMAIWIRQLRREMLRETRPETQEKDSLK